MSLSHVVTIVFFAGVVIFEVVFVVVIVVLTIPDCRLVSMIAANHAKASMILVVMLDHSMTVRPVKLTLSLTDSHPFFSFSFIMGGMPLP